MTVYCGERRDITEGSSWDVETCYRPMRHAGDCAYSLDRPDHIRRCGECSDLFDVTDGAMLGSGARAWFRCAPCRRRDDARWAALVGSGMSERELEEYAGR